MPQSLLRSSLALFAALFAFLAIGCGDDEKPAKKPKKPRIAEVEGPGDGIDHAPEASLGGGGGGAVADDEEEEEELEDLDDVVRLELHATPVNDHVAWGEPVLVRLEIRNTGGRNVRLVEPGRDLRDNFEVRVYSGRSVHVLGRRMRRPENAGPVKLFLLEPGYRVGTEVDLHAVFVETTSYQQGEVDFEIHYSGAADLAKGTPNLWNADGAETLVSQRVRIDVSPPKWLEQFADMEAEGAEEKLAQVVAETHNDLLTYNPVAPNAAEVLARVTERGDTGAAALCLAVERMGRWDEKEAAMGGSALGMLRQLGEPALKVLRKITEHPHPARDMALRILEVDDRKRRKLPADKGSQLARAVAGGTGSGSLLLVDIGGGSESPVRYTLDDQGFFTVAHPANKGEQAKIRQLSSQELVRIKRAVVDTRPWCWRAVRNGRMADEGTVFVTLTDGNGANVSSQLPEKEAKAANPFSSELLKILAEIAVADEAPPDQPPDEGRSKSGGKPGEKPDDSARKPDDGSRER